MTWGHANIYGQYMSLCCFDMTPCHYLWIVHVTVLPWQDTLPLFMNSTSDCVAMTWHPVTIYGQYMSLCCYDMRPCQYLWTVHVTVLLWHDTLPLFMNSTCHCVAITRHPATIYEQYMWLCCYDMTPCHYVWTVHVTVLLWHETLPLFTNSTCHCVAMTRQPATIYGQYMWLCCYDMTPCHYAWTVHVTVLLWHEALPLFTNSTCHCVAMTWGPATIYKQYISLCCYDMMPCHYLWTVHVTVLLWQDTLPLFMNSTCHCVAMTWCLATIYEQYMSMCCYDMTPHHYLWTVHVTVLLWQDTLPPFMNSTCHCVAMTWCPVTIYEQYMSLCWLWHDTQPLFMNSTCHCVAMTRHPANIYEKYTWLCCYDMTPCHYLWKVHMTVLLWHEAVPLFMNSTCHCVAMTWHPVTTYE